MTRPEPPNDPGHWPKFCCAIIRDGDGRHVLERRPPDDRFPRGRLTCFGGGREQGEHPADCIRRELVEELGWDVPPDAVIHTVTLIYQGPPRQWRRGPLGAGHVLAWFYRVLPVAPAPELLRPEPGVRVERLPLADLPFSDLSPWHLVALEGDAAGRREIPITR